VRNFALVNIHEDVKMQGYITYTGSSSMEVTIDILAARPDRDDLLAETKFIMVARAGDKAGKVPGLLLANDEVTAIVILLVLLLRRAVAFSIVCP
jgi:acyl-CoA hydrolase